MRVIKDKDLEGVRDIERAKELLARDGNTCVLVRGDSVLISGRKGIAPMLGFIDTVSDLSGYSVADKIVGRAAALLFALAKITTVYAEVLSEGAQEILDKFAIRYSFSKKVDYIINRSGTGICPMEEAVRDILDPGKAHSALLKKLAELKAAQNVSV